MKCPKCGLENIEYATSCDCGYNFDTKSLGAPKILAASPIEKSKKQIRNAVALGIFSGTVTLIVTILSLFGMQLYNINLWSLIDVLIIFGLTYGFYKKSRVCAILMFTYFIFGKLWMYMENKKSITLTSMIIIGYFLLKGVIGVFSYHNLTHEKQIQLKKERIKHHSDSKKITNISKVRWRYYILKLWLIPAVICLVSLIAWTFRWQNEMEITKSFGKIIIVRDNWTNQRWERRYNIYTNTFTETPCNVRNVRSIDKVYKKRNFVSIIGVTILSFSIFWLIVLYILKVQEKVTNNNGSHPCQPSN